MRVCRFDGGRLGVLHDGAIHDISPFLDTLPMQRYPLPRHDLLVEALPRLHAELPKYLAGAPRLDPERVHFDSPVANPGKIIGAPINYQLHIEESKANSEIGHGREIKTIAEWGLFLKAGSSLVGCSDEVRLRFPERRNDHEIELGVVIGATCQQVSRADALKYVAGYSVALDMTVRGPEFQCFRKSVDTYAVLGPWLVTSDEVPDPGNLDLWLDVNHEARQRSNTRHMVYDVPRLIEFASSFYTLQPGDIIMTGTPEGVGPVRPGDLMEAGVGDLGTLKMRIAPEYA